MSKLRLLWRVAFFCFLGITMLAAQDFTLYDIYVVDMKTGQTRQVTHIPNAGEFNPGWSYNGKLIVHDVVTPDRSDLYITDVETGVSTLLPGASGGNDAAWSPNGQTIAFDRLPYGDLSIYTLPPGGGIPARVRTDAVDASWSPDNNHFVFRQPSDGTIRTASLSGGPARQLGYGETPAWSPNGLWVVFSSGGDLWKIRVSNKGIPSGSSVQLTNHPDWENQPTWTNDSKAIIFHSSRGGADFDLWTIPAEGGIPTKLTGRAGAGDYDPSVSNNGKFVAYAAVGEGVSIVGHSPGTIDRYSMSLSALKGPSTTDVCVMVSTSDPANYPLPSTLKKLQLKVLNNDGAVSFLQNYFDVPLLGGKACVSVDRLVPYQPVRVQAHIKTDQTIDEEILRGTATVFLRPDLVVDGVNAPQEVNKNVRFNVEARIRERNLQVGVRATVGLFEGTNQLASASGVVVPAGEMVSVVFEGIRLSEPGTHELTIRISNADPAEYDETNNALSFSINVLDVSVRPMGYYFFYYLSEYTSKSRFNSCWWNSDYMNESAYRSFSFYAYDYPEAILPASPLDRLSWKIGSEAGVWSQGALSNIAAAYGDPYFEYYTVNLDPARPLYAYIYVYKYDFFKYVAFSVSQYASRYVYRVVVNGVVYADYFYQDGIPENIIDVQQHITSSFLISDGDYNAGGGVVMPVYGYSSSSSASDAGHSDYYGCDFSWSSEYSNRYETGSQSGVTDPGILPSGAQTSILSIDSIGGFENNVPGYWNKGNNPSGSTLTWATDQFKSLGHSLKITKSATSDSAAWISDNMVDYWAPQHLKDVDIKLGAYVKTQGVNTSPANNDQRWYIAYTFYDFTGAFIGQTKLPIDQSVATSSGWIADTNGVGATVLPVDAWKTIITFVGGKNATGTVWADDFIFYGRGGQWAGQDWNTGVAVPTGWLYWFPPIGGNDGVVENGFENTVVTTEAAHSGLQSLKFVMPFNRQPHDGFAGTKRILFNGLGAGIKAGDVLRISVWIKASNLVPDSAALYPSAWAVGFTPGFWRGNGNNDEFNNVSGYPQDLQFVFPSVTSFDWTQYYIDVTVPSDPTTKALDLRLHIYARFTGTIYFDDLTVKKLDIPQLSGIGDLENLSERNLVPLIPRETQLLANFPNPFNPSTLVSFTVERQGTAVLKVYNVLGQEVAELFNGLAEPGKLYRLTFDAGRLSTGLYFTKLEFGGKQIVKRMLCVK